MSPLYVHEIVCVDPCLRVHLSPWNCLESRAGIEPRSFAFQASGLTITPPSLPAVSTLSTFTCPCGSLPERSVQTITYLNYKYYFIFNKYMTSKSQCIINLCCGLLNKQTKIASLDTGSGAHTRLKQGLLSHGNTN